MIQLQDKNNDIYELVMNRVVKLFKLFMPSFSIHLVIKALLLDGRSVHN